MKAPADSERSSPAVRRIVCVLAAIPLASVSPALAQGSRIDDAEEVFAAIDPYTRGDPGALHRAGYVSFGPFQWMAGSSTQEIEDTLGELRVLWVETAHFKLGSTLGTYSYPGDQLEKGKLREELARLAEKLEGFDPPRNRLDPWLRLHLYAQRLEGQYAEFQRLFGLRDADCGPLLGMPMKFTVLLTEKSSTLARFLRRHLDLDASGTWRCRLEGGTMFLGISAEHVRLCGYELDAALHCGLAEDLAHNFVDGFRDNHNSSAMWFKNGLGSWFSRRVDERWTIYARGTTLLFGDDSWSWAPRVRGLVSNGLAIPWPRMLDWMKWEDIDAQGHMVLWSRVDWMLSCEDADLRVFLEEMTKSIVAVPEEERASTRRARQIAALVAGFGGTPDELDERWRRFVQENARGK